MRIVVGLGNIGKEYENTNHNMGFMVVDRALSKLNITKSKESCNGIIYESNVDGEKVYFVKPTTYMNNSGICLASVLSKYNVDITDCLVVVDDIDIPKNAIRIRKSGSAGTHNGLKSLVHYCGENFNRLRFGVGQPAENQDLISFVLAKVKKDQNFENAIEKASDAVVEYARGASVDSIMQKYNG